jgi:hypothetical protein
MIQFWTIANILKLNYTLRKKITFYAPLLDSLDFMGIDGVTFTRASTSTAIRRDSFIHAVAVNVPRFQYGPDANGYYELNLGIAMTSGESLSYAVENLLSNSSTLIWFEDRVPKSTPTNSNPFNSSGVYVGNLGIHVSHVCKADSVLANSEITAIQAALLDVPPQTIPLPPSSVANIGTFVTETPSGGTGTTFTLSQNPDLNSLIVSWSGLYLKRVASAPAELQFTAGGTGNRTLTLGSSVVAGQNIVAQYVTA